MRKDKDKCYASYVNTRSTLAEYGGWLVGEYHLLCLYCAEHEYEGVIQDCKSWTDRQWLLRVGLDKYPEDVPGLFHWEGDNLIIEGYNSPIFLKSELYCEE